MAHTILRSPFLLGELPFFFSGMRNSGNWHQVSCLILHYEVVDNIFRKGGGALYK